MWTRSVFAATMAGIACLTILFSSAEAVAADTAVSEAAVRNAIAKSLPYVEDKGLYWIEKKKCVSCHRVSFMTWSLSSAARRGFDVDIAQINKWIDWSIETEIPQSKDGRPAASKNVDGLTQKLLSKHEYPPGQARDEQWPRFVDLITSGQRANGSWKPAGQLPGQKREQAETTDVCAVWHTAALTRELATEQDSARQQQLKTAITKARKTFADRQEATSTEWYVARLILARESADKAGVAEFTAKLLSLQQPDGSWGWLTSDPGDALATGMSLYALVTTDSDDSKHNKAIERAISFLVNTQRDDGSWAVKGTKEKKKENIEETAVYWGTAWATIALLETLPVIK